MTYVAPARWRAALLAYMLGGLVAGLANPALCALAGRTGVRPGFGTAFDVNVLLPLLAVIVAIVYPRVWTACLGALLLAAGFIVGARLIAQPNVLLWSPASIAASVHPILLVGSVGYAVVGVITALTVRSWRIVGLPDARMRCERCGYLLVNLPHARCPECGQEFDPARLLRTE